MRAITEAINPDTKVVGRAIYAASGVLGKTLSSWHTRGFLSREVWRTGEGVDRRLHVVRFLPEPQHGKALEYSILDTCVLRLARTLTELGLTVRSAMEEASDCRWPISAILANAVKGGDYLLVLTADQSEQAQMESLAKPEGVPFLGTSQVMSAEDAQKFLLNSVSTRIVNLTILASTVVSMILAFQSGRLIGDAELQDGSSQ